MKLKPTFMLLVSFCSSDNIVAAASPIESCAADRLRPSTYQQFIYGVKESRYTKVRK